jgi:hypothetical protein
MEDPRYVDDPFDDRDLSIEGADLYYPDLCQEAFYSCGRRRNMFKSDQELSRWRRIDRLIESGDIPKEWIRDRCIYAEKYRMGLPKLMTAILNAGKMEEWMVRNKMTVTRGVISEEEKGVIRQDYRHF